MMSLDFYNLLTPSKDPFYSIVLGNSSTPNGLITFSVTFGTPTNYRMKQIKFEAVDFESSYHAILGRPSLAKFMVVPNYIYLVLKMPGKTGVSDPGQQDCSRAWNILE